MLSIPYFTCDYIDTQRCVCWPRFLRILYVHLSNIQPFCIERKLFLSMPGRNHAYAQTWMLRRRYFQRSVDIVVHPNLVDSNKRWITEDLCANCRDILCMRPNLHSALGIIDTYFIASVALCLFIFIRCHGVSNIYNSFIDWKSIFICIHIYCLPLYFLFLFYQLFGLQRKPEKSSNGVIQFWTPSRMRKTIRTKEKHVNGGGPQAYRPTVVRAQFRKCSIELDGKLDQLQ